MPCTDDICAVAGTSRAACAHPEIHALLNAGRNETGVVAMVGVDSKVNNKLQLSGRL